MSYPVMMVRKPLQPLNTILAHQFFRFDDDPHLYSLVGAQIITSPGGFKHLLIENEDRKRCKVRWDALVRPVSD